jgi:hypothetical protein
MPTPTPQPDRIQPHAAAKDPAAVKVTSYCPSCGRKNAVVFSVIPSANSQPDEKPRLVCLACCPKVPSEA